MFLSLTRYGSFYSVGCEAHWLEFGVKIFVYAGHIALEVMVANNRRNFMSGWVRNWFLCSELSET
jgi:hypothetical protein